MKRTLQRGVFVGSIALNLAVLAAVGAVLPIWSAPSYAERTHAALTPLRAGSDQSVLSSTFSFEGLLTGALTAFLSGFRAEAADLGASEEASDPQRDPPPAAASDGIEAPVATIEVRNMAQTAEFAGFLQAVEHVDIRPRISGHIESIHFEEGAVVEAGALLFQIDPRPFELSAERARAELDQAREQLALAKLQYGRARDLVEGGAVSRESYDEAASRKRALAAGVWETEAAVRHAELDLAYTRVAAPVAGRVGRALVTKGNLVSNGIGGATLLTTLVSVDPVHVLFDVDERVYLKALNARRGGAFPADADIGVSVQLIGETGFPHQGRLDFIDNRAHPGTGTIRVRAVLPNPAGRLTPGLFARVRLELAPPRETLLIDERAIGADQGRQFVLALNDDNVAEYRPVQLGPRIEGLREVRAGLAADDVVIVGALHRVRPGQPVTPIRTDKEVRDIEASQ